MAIEITEVKHGFFITMDASWGSEADIKALDAAKRLYKDLKLVNKYVCIIKSYYEYAQGYLVETKKREIKYPDFVLEEYVK